MRLFAGLPLSPAAADRLASLRLRLSQPNDGLRWSAPEQWHITLQFYGDIDLDRAACLQEALSTVREAAPAVSLETLGSFPAKGILHVLVSPTPSLVALQHAVIQAGQRCGVRPENRVFRPHITLARSKGRTGNTCLRKLSSPSLPPFGGEIRWHATEILLYQSTLRPQGSEYTVLSRFGLTTGSHGEATP